MLADFFKFLYIILCMTIASHLFFGCNNANDTQHKQSEQHKKRPPSSAYGTALFEGTPVYELAKAIEKEHFSEVKAMIKADPKLLQYEEEYFDYTILKWAIDNEKLKATQILLESGADPNLSRNGQSAIVIAAAVRETSEYLKLVLKYGGNPNHMVVDSNFRDKTDPHLTYYTPLIVASEISLENVKLLVAAGADVNLHLPTRMSPIYIALATCKYDIVEYLILCNADFKHIPNPFRDSLTVNILESLRKRDFPLNSRDHKNKMTFVAFLKTKGLDYSKEPIPDFIREKYDEYYLKNY